MNSQDDSFPASGAKQRNKLATYGKASRNAIPSHTLFSPQTVLDNNEDLPRVVEKKSASKLRAYGSSVRRGTNRKLEKRLSPTRMIVPETKSLYDVPSSDSEDDANSRSSGSSKKRKLGYQATNAVQDVVYDDESLQRHIAAEARRDQENLFTFTRVKQTSKPQLGISATRDTIARNSRVAMENKRPEPRTSMPKKHLIAKKSSVADQKPVRHSKKGEDLATNQRKRASTPALPQSHNLEDVTEVPPVPPTPVLHNASLAHKVSTARARALPSEEGAAPRSSRNLSNKAPNLRKGPSDPQLQSKDSHQRPTTPQPHSPISNVIMIGTLTDTPPTPIARSNKVHDKGYQESPSTIGIQRIQLSSPQSAATLRAQSPTATRTLTRMTDSAATLAGPRRRIIDRLQRQASISSTQSSNGEESDETGCSDNASKQSSTSPPSQHVVHNVAAVKPTLENSASEKDPEEFATQQTSKSLQSTYGGTKITYQHQRSYLTEEMVDEADLFKLPILPDPIAEKPSRRSKALKKLPTLPGLPSLRASFELEEDPDDTTTGTARNIHELRQAGGNARLIGGMEAILDDIDLKKGASLSTRRNGLLDLCRSLAQPASCQAFIDHGLVDQLFAQLDNSLDEVTGVLVMSCFRYILSQQCSVHLISLLNDCRVFEFLDSRLRGIDNFKTVVGKRKSNLSQVMQQELLQLSDSLLASSIWTDGSPSCLTARTLSLHCLEGVVRHLREAGCISNVLSRHLVSSLVGIAAPAPDASRTFQDSAPHAGSLDFCQAISILEYTTVASQTTEGHETAWTSDSIEQISHLLPTLCNQTGDESGKAQMLILRLCLNLTNENSLTCEIFSKPGVVCAAIATILSGFRGLHQEEDADLHAILLDNVVLALGLLINLAESSDAARLQFTTSTQGHTSSLDTLLQLFNSNVARASEVVSERDTQSNVAFGYLSVLIAHLSLNRAIRQRVKSQLQGATLKPLLNAVGEFLEYHRRVTNSIIQQGEEEVDLKAGFLKRLQELLDQLQATQAQ